MGSQEETRDLVENGGRRHRFKEVTEKEWLTPFGLVRVPRRYFQPDRGVQGIVPLDVRCGMEDRYMTPDLEEACAMGSAMLVPREVETFLKKVLPQGPSATAIQKVIKDVGGFAEENQDLVEEGMSEKAPLQGTGDVLVASWDGVTVPLSERGRKRGRPRERPAGEERKSEKGREWYDEHRARLKEDPGGVAALVRSLRYYMQKTRWRSERRTIIRRTIAYFQNNKDRMRYAQFIARGLPIRSGPVEAACKTVVGARLKRSGMRWTRERGQRVLNLRVHHLSKRWNTFWQAHQADRMAA